MLETRGKSHVDRENLLVFQCGFFLLEIFIFIYLCGCGRSQLQQAESFSCSRWDLDPRPGTEPRPPALGEQSLSHCTTKEVPLCTFIIIFSSEDTYSLLRLPWWLSEESACNVGDPGSIPGVGRFPWRRKWQPTPVFLPGEFHGEL